MICPHGLDVHKETIAIAYTHAHSRNKPTFYKICSGSNLSCERNLRKLAKELGLKIQDLKVCYEAGPTGFVLARHLISLGVDCVICSPSRTERNPNEPIKTDKRDAQKLAKLFKNGDITEVRIPPALDEAVRDVCRLRTDTMDHLSRIRQQLLSFLLRNGIKWSGKSNWTPSHMRYLRKLKMQSNPHHIVLEEYIQAVDSAQERLTRVKERLVALLDDWEWKPVINVLAHLFLTGSERRYWVKGYHHRKAKLKRRVRD